MNSSRSDKILSRGWRTKAVRLIVDQKDAGSSPVSPASSILDFGLPILDWLRSTFQSKIRNLKSKMRGRLAETD